MTGTEAERLIRRSDRVLSRLENRALRDLQLSLQRSITELRRELRVLYARMLENTASIGAPVREAYVLRQLEQLRVIQRALELPPGTTDQILRELITGSLTEGADSAFLALSIWDREVVALGGSVPLGAMSAGTRITPRLVEIGDARVATGRARLVQHTEAAARQIQAHVIDGITRGVGWGQTAREVQGSIGGLWWNAERLVRTESVTAAHAARAETYREAGITMGQWLATMDDRVCGYCAARAGNVYRLDDVVIPAHPNCRCYLQPWREEWAELGLDDPEFYAAHRRGAINRARESGHKIPRGPSRGELWAGMTTAPEPVRTPR